MMLAALRNRAYARLFAAQVLALVGTGLLTVALGLLAVDVAGNEAGIVMGTALTIRIVAFVTISPVMSAPAEAPWAPAAGVAGFVESEAPPHATSEAAETSESAVMARRRERRMGVLSVQCDCEAGSAGSRPGAGPPGLRPPVVPVRTGPDGAAAIVTGESGKNRVLGRHRARFRRSRAARRRAVICRLCEPHAIWLQRSMTLKPNG